MADTLAALNALLNLVSFSLLIYGYIAIRSHDRDRHKRFMLGALGCSIAFLVSYVTRFALSGVHRFPEVGTIKSIYLLILGTHTVLAASLALLVPITVAHALKDRIEKHRTYAKWTWPIWMYVSSTGVVIYLMLYHLAPRLV